ncbi:MAG: CRISPR system precrRNA processing endoribonuclease RAMP protein Cas6 [Anaerolineae bacterium]
MYHITYTFAPVREPLNGRLITAHSLHGFLFNITAQADREESDWLHHHVPPRPFTMVPLYTDDGTLAGIRVAAITERATNLLTRTGEWFRDECKVCHLKGQEFLIDAVRCLPGPGWQHLAHTQPARQMGLRFLSPTAFSQKGNRRLLLPLPVNVFRSPARMWSAFAPPMMARLDGWLDWCERNVMVSDLRIETVTVNIRERVTFTGFVGEVWYEASRGDEMQLRIWQALADLAAFCGAGYKSTMGMGAVERI